MLVLLLTIKYLIIMYKITKIVNAAETINLVFDDVKLAKEVFNDLKYDEFVRFVKLYGREITKETKEKIVDGKLVCNEYNISIPTFFVTITLQYIED